MKSPKLRTKPATPATKRPAQSRNRAGSRRPTRAPHRTNSAEILGGSTDGRSLSLRSIPAKWRWHYRVLRSLQSRLLRDRGDLLQAGAEPLESHSLDPADSATDEFDHNMALSQLSAEQDALYEVTEAFKRMVEGTYGTCEETGRAIPAARLKAIPWTRFTRDVEERLEKKGMVPRPRVNEASTVRPSGRIWLAPEEEAEEVEENPPSPAKDEALSHVFSPPGRHLSPPKSSRRPPPRATPEQKGRPK